MEQAEERKLQVMVPTELYEILRRLAFENRTTIKQIVTDILREALT